MRLLDGVALGTAVAVAVAVVAAARDAVDVAVAALAIALLGLLIWLMLRDRALQSELVEIRRSTNRARRAAGGTKKSQARLRGQLTRAEAQLSQVGREVNNVRNNVLRTPGLTAEFVRAYDRLVDHAHPMPEAGSFAATPSTLLWMLDHVESLSVGTVVECGSGSSTVWLATALKRCGEGGRVIALESSGAYARQTRDHLERLGLAPWAQVMDTPLVETPLPDGTTQPWFDISGLDPELRIELLFVDGPPGGTAPLARYPAFPMLAARLAAGATIVLDDTGRPDEDRIAARWCGEVHHGRILEISRVVDRSTVFGARVMEE